MPVSERKKSFCSPTFRESERTGSCSTHRVYRECVGVNRVTGLGAMPVFFITRGEEDAAGQEASFGPPCSPHPRAKDVCVTPAHSVPQPPVWQGQRPPLSRPRCGTLGPRLTLGKSVGETDVPFDASWWQRGVRLSFCEHGPGLQCGLSQCLVTPRGLDHKAREMSWGPRKDHSQPGQTGGESGLGLGGCVRV